MLFRLLQNEEKEGKVSMLSCWGKHNIATKLMSRILCIDSSKEKKKNDMSILIPTKEKFDLIQHLFLILKILFTQPEQMGSP